VDYGKFIVFDGADGVGKTTMARRLTQWLVDAGVPTILAKESESADPAAAALYEAAVGDAVGGRLEPVALHLLFASMRAQHVARVVRPALTSGTWVVGDRHSLSGLVYAGYGLALPLRNVWDVERTACGPFRSPSLTIVLFRRRGKVDGEQFFERKGDDFQRRVRYGYAQEAKTWGLPMVSTDCSEDETFDKVLLHVKPLLREAAGD
jgi:dTMP kinase